LQKVLLPRKTWPTTLTIQTIQINNCLFVSLPGEVSVEMGARIKHDARVAAHDHHLDVSHVVIFGLANQYADYFTTPEEYEFQNYEGASMILGPAAGVELGEQVARLLGEQPSRSDSVDLPSSWTFKTGFVLGHFPTDAKDPVYRAAYDIEVQSEDSQRSVSFEWHDLGPERIKLNEPLVSLQTQTTDGGWIEYMDGNGVPVDDRGAQIEVRLLGPNFRNITEAGSNWRATWYARNSCTSSPLRFAIAERYPIGELVSAPFSPKCAH
jgi:hypothetical protein